MSELYSALEICLQAVEDGQKIESVLARYPEFERELRPLLEVSLLARKSSQFDISEAVKHRGRVRLLQRVNELRKANSVSHHRIIPFLPRVAIVLSLVGILGLTSTGFVSASSGTLPGDQLYPVKRTWEGVRLFFAFNSGEHDLLESQFEQARLDEVDGLLGRRIAAPIEFKGLVTRQANGKWQVSGIPVSITGSTSSAASGIPDGAPVIVTGITGSDGVVEARDVQLLQSGGQLPPLGPSVNSEPNSSSENENGNVVSTPVIIVTPGLSVPGSQNSIQQQKTYQFSGVVQSQQKDIWIINGQSVSVTQADVVTGIKVGSVVKFDGYYSNDGMFVVTKVEVKSGDNSNKPKNDVGGNGSGNSGSSSDNSRNGSGNYGNGQDGQGGSNGGDGGSSDGGDH
jgi:uncharacterized membrane protein YgcG